MDIVALVAIVMAVTEVVKQWAFLAKISPIILSIIISLGVVAYKAVETGTPFNLALLFIFAQVVFAANGAHKLIGKVGNGKPA